VQIKLNYKKIKKGAISVRRRVLKEGEVKIENYYRKVRK
jgi:hypothetical protein